MLQIVFRFLEEILWCNPTILDRWFICSFTKQIRCLELLRFSTLYTIMHFETFLLVLSHTQCAPDDICKTKQEITWKLILWIQIVSLRKSANLLVCVFSSLPRHCYCGTCRVIIATFVPAISGPPFCMDAMRKSMGKYKMTQEMGCFTFETINSQVVLGYMSIIFVAGLH